MATTPTLGHTDDAAPPTGDTCPDAATLMGVTHRCAYPAHRGRHTFHWSGWMVSPEGVAYEVLWEG